MQFDRPSNPDHQATERHTPGTHTTKWGPLLSGALSFTQVARQRSELQTLAGPAAALLYRLVELGIVEQELIDAFLYERRDRLAEYTTEDRVGQALVHAGLLTAYQLDRVHSGTAAGLVFGNYRVLEGLGSGGMGVVYLAEHRLMRRRVALKVLPVDEECPVAVRQRFYGEMRLLAELNHPNIVLAFDAGEVAPAGPDMPGQIYLVMEVVDGGDLEKLVVRNGPCDFARACDLVRQAACGLQAAHDRHLVHRDIKPSNLLLTTSGHVKLVDFGLARQFSSRLTDPRTLLGSVEFMAPEQSRDPSSVGKEADIYGLGATLFWLLTGEAPYEFHASIGAALKTLQRDEARRLRDLRRDVPVELDQLVARMLDSNPSNRPVLPVTIAHALTSFAIAPGGGARTVIQETRHDRPGRVAIRRVLVVEEQEHARRARRRALEALDCVFVECSGVPAALAEVEARSYDVVLLGESVRAHALAEVCQRMRERSTSPYLQIFAFSSRAEPDALPRTLQAGADDLLVEPVEAAALSAKVGYALRLKEARERTDAVAEQLLAANRQLQQSLDSRGVDVYDAHNAMLFAMAKMAESRDGETPGHLQRLQGYTRLLALEAAKLPPWSGVVDERFLAQLERCVPLHDIGKIGLPDDILLKPASLSAAERALVETHPLIGDRILEALGREHGTALDFLGVARGIVRHHHERFDGRGYPDRLGRDAIPAAARLTAVADVYDALRRERLHKPAMAHAEAVGVLLTRSEGQFDPMLLVALEECHPQIERIYRDISD
jgi:response regulator RpfG family c-di-GMP phosphodiesterase